MKSYTFHNISEVEIRDGDKITRLTVGDDKLDELRRFSHIVSEQENKKWSINPFVAPEYGHYHAGRLDGMIELYAEIMRSVGAREEVYESKI